MASAFDVGKELEASKIEQLVKKEYQVKISSYLSHGWQLFKQKPGDFIGFTVLVLLISALTSFIPFASPFLMPPLYAGFFVVGFKLLAKQSVEFSNFWQGFSYFLALVLASILMGIFIFIGFLLLIIPGIYLSVAYSFTVPFIVQKQMHFWQAMETSRRLISNNWFSFFGLLLVLGLINIVGAILLLVGLLVTIPWTFLTIAAAYFDIVGFE